MLDPGGVAGGDVGWLSVKAMTPGLARAEYEYPVPVSEADAMLDALCARPFIEKSYLHYGYALIEALVLAKVIMVGEALHLGDRYRDQPLIVPTLYKTFLFSLLFLVFIALEDLVTGWIHRQSLGEIVHHVLSESIYEKLARTLVTFVALIPLFAYREVGRILGEGRLAELFLKPRPTPSGEGGSR